jgi:dihydrofolate reductase
VASGFRAKILPNQKSLGRQALSRQRMSAEVAGVPLVLIAAVAENGVIGRDNGLIWRLKTDLQRFRTLTLGRPVLMGRKTYQSIGRPLPGRQTIVLTRDRNFAAAGVHLAHDLTSALALGQSLAAQMAADTVAVAGGGEIYAQTMEHADRIALTLVHTRPQGDAVFPPIAAATFREERRSAHAAGPDDAFAFEFIDYARIG